MGIYYRPEKFGLQMFGEIEFEGGYEHDKIAVWTREGSDLFLYGHSSGCSCRSPFEYHGVGDLHEGTANDVLAFIEKKIDSEATGYFRDRTASWRMQATALYERMVQR